MNQTLLRTQAREDTSDIVYPLNAVTLGIRQIQAPVVRPMGLPLHQLFYCSRGFGELNINQEIFHIYPGCGFYLKMDIAHSYHSLGDDWELSYMGFDGPICETLMRSLHMPDSCAFRLPDDTGFLHKLELLSDYVSHGTSRSKKHLSSMTYDCLVELATHRDHVFAVSENQTENEIQRIMSYLQNHYSHDISLYEIANEVGFSKEYMCSYFKKHMHRTIMQTLLDIRIMNACAFLNLHPEKRVAEIAAMCGFESPSYFCSVFKKHQGMTPDTYRKRR